MKYLVELNSPNVPADFIELELSVEFGRAPEPTEDPDILRLEADDSEIAVLCDYDNNRVWITIESPSGESYRATSQRIEALLDRSRESGFIEWSQIEIDPPKRLR
ncbi:MAG TPA: hypothetical protein VJZ27_17145 [Aggregatilineales bacterium]|nr:hypothetical protein [Aggregatilineales bacterium]